MSIVYILLYNPEMHVMYIGMYAHKCFIIPTNVVNVAIMESSFVL